MILSLLKSAKKKPQKYIMFIYVKVSLCQNNLKKRKEKVFLKLSIQ